LQSVGTDEHGFEDLQEFWSAFKPVGEMSGKESKKSGTALRGLKERSVNTLLAHKVPEVTKDNAEMESLTRFWDSIGALGNVAVNYPSSEVSDSSSPGKAASFRESNDSLPFGSPHATESLFGSTTSSPHGNTTPTWESLTKALDGHQIQDDLSEALSEVGSPSSEKIVDETAKARLASLVWHQLVKLLRERFVPTVRSSLVLLVRTQLGKLVKKELQDLSRRVSKAEEELSDPLEEASNLSIWSSDAGGSSVAEQESAQSSQEVAGTSGQDCAEAEAELLASTLSATGVRISRSRVFPGSSARKVHPLQDYRQVLDSH
jgi:hypothetical protein